MDTFLDVIGIVKRAKQALNFKNDSELAAYLGVSRGTAMDIPCETINAMAIVKFSIRKNMIM